MSLYFVFLVFWIWHHKCLIWLVRFSFEWPFGFVSRSWLWGTHNVIHCYFSLFFFPCSGTPSHAWFWMKSGIENLMRNNKALKAAHGVFSFFFWSFLRRRETKSLRIWVKNNRNWCYQTEIVMFFIFLFLWYQNEIIVENYSLIPYVSIVERKVGLAFFGQRGIYIFVPIILSFVPTDGSAAWNFWIRCHGIWTVSTPVSLICFISFLFSYLFFFFSRVLL